MVVEGQGERDAGGQTGLPWCCTSRPGGIRFNPIDVAAATLLRCLNRFAKPVCRTAARMIHSPMLATRPGDATGTVPCLRRQLGASGHPAGDDRGRGRGRRRVEDRRVVRLQQPWSAERRHRLADHARSPIRSAIDRIPVARMLTQRRTGTIGLLTPQALASIFSNPFFGMFSAGVAAVAEEAGYGLHFISPLHGSLSRAIGRATRRRGRRDRPRRPTIPRSPRSGGPACR